MARRWLVAAVLLAGVGSVARADYTITDLGVLPGGSTSHGIAVNSEGLVTGFADPGSLSNHAFVTGGGSSTLTDLGTLGGASSHGMAINVGGVVVGDSALGNGHTQAFDVIPGLPMQAIPLANGWTDSYGTGVNDANQVVGYALISGGGDRAFVGTIGGGAPTTLGTLGGPNSMAFGINAEGAVVGAADTASGQTHAFITFGSAMIDLGGLGTSGSSVGLAVNNAGVVVGYGGYAGAQHAFRTRADGSLEDLGSLSGSSGTSMAYAINNLGVVVGSSSAPGLGTRAFILGAGSSSMVDLNTLLPAGSGWLLTSANGVNDLGQVTGTGVFEGQTHAFLMTPSAVTVPEPPGWLLAGLGAAALAAFHARRPRG